MSRVRSNNRLLLIILVAIVISLLLVVRSSDAYFVQLGSKLVGESASTTPNQGYSVAISGDAMTALIGGPYEWFTAVGAAWVFTRSGDSWSQQTKLTGSSYSGGPMQGTSVALSFDGNTALIGAEGDDSYVGATWVFTRSGGSWSQEAKLVGDNVVGSKSKQGHSVALSHDGSIAVVGGLSDNNFFGAVWVFIRNGTSGQWRQSGSKLVGTGASVNGYCMQGYAVAISGDGNTLLNGGSYEDFVGATWVFVRNQSTGAWSQQGTKLVGSEPTNFGYQGSALALSYDGNTAVIGGSGQDAMWIFTRNLKSVWTQQGSKLGPGDGVGATNFGFALSVSGDGNTVAVGGYTDTTNLGATWVFIRNTTSQTWSQPYAKLFGSGSTQPDWGAGPLGGVYQGKGVSLSFDANTLLVGAPADNLNMGATWVFVRDVIATTLSPSTSRPSRSPSRSPSRTPSRPPTTSWPSKTPSRAPTSQRPSSTPTSARPSKTPTTSPTSSRPSFTPSFRPSRSPVIRTPQSSPTLNIPKSSRSVAVMFDNVALRLACLAVLHILY